VLFAQHRGIKRGVPYNSPGLSRNNPACRAISVIGLEPKRNRQHEARSFCSINHNRHRVRAFRNGAGCRPPFWRRNTALAWPSRHEPRSSVQFRTSDPSEFRLASWTTLHSDQSVKPDYRAPSRPHVHQFWSKKINRYRRGRAAATRTDATSPALGNGAGTGFQLAQQAGRSGGTFTVDRSGV
jgi:hypothetical protein